MSTPTITPNLLISTRSTPLLRLPAYEAAAHEAAFTGIDLDGVGDVRRAMVAGRSLERAIAHHSVRSLWLRPVQLDGVGELPLATPQVAAGNGRPPLLLVIDVPQMIAEPDALGLQVQAAARVRSLSDRPLDIALAVRAQNPDGSRRNLERVTMLRHVCSEWDLQIALDLLPKPDGSWEAEAALARILPRLAMVRIGIPRTMFSGGHRWRIASRVVATLADGGYAGYLSLAPELSLWEKRSTVTVADRCASFAANVERRAVRQRNQRARRPRQRQIG